MSLTTRMVLWVTFSVIAIFTAASIYDYALTRALLDEQLRQRTELEVSASETQLSDTLARLQHQADLTSALIGEITPTQNKLEAMIKTSMQQYPDAYGMAIVAESKRSKQNQPFASYFYRAPAGLRFVDLSDETYNLHQQEWYLQAAQTGQSGWTEPYVDVGGGNVLMTTYLAPIKTEQSLTLVTIDLAVSSIQNMLANIEDGKHGMSIYAITPGGHIISGHDETLMLRQLEEIEKHKDQLPEWYEDLLTEIKQRKSGSFSDFCPRMQESCWISYAPLADTQWTLLVSYSQANLKSQLITYSQHRLLLMLLGIALLAVVIWMITRRQIMPLRELDKATLAFAEGKLDYKLPKAPRNDEIGSLTQRFGQMQVSLKDHIDKLKHETQQRERINSELNTASQIQQSLLPLENSINDSKSGLELSAYLEPARAVGGDLYYYEIQDSYDIHNSQQLSFVIGDVSDKGVAAAIFMARVVTAIRAIAEHTQDPAQILSDLNHQLVDDNEACMFVTLLSGTLNLRTGVLQLASAGHPMPLLIDSNQQVTQIEQLNGPAIGLYEYIYESVNTVLKPNSYLFAYTDGLDEAANDRMELYGDDRILSTVAEAAPSNANDLINTVVNSVSQFVGDAEAADDLTLLAIHWSGDKDLQMDHLPLNNSQVNNMISITSSTEELEKINAYLSKYISHHDLPEHLLLTSQLVAEELIANTIHYGYDDKTGMPISLHLSHNEKEMTLLFVDQAKAFNPLEQGEARLGLPADDEPVGGLGIHLVKEMSNSCEYRYIAGENQFSLTLLIEN
ncbi:SpoIIE family protein phosphatase [Alkalimarinus sediminis]|uniref:SpoIIE family protein phosphatase n=1 Tax=Alkalimarinus sediminis TaxID=1632866 RepID=A0A9E8KQI5_9ALTE|nr:SpoIIE family protein phosphatase [Alkalimarinus sediminis]UZW74767.1 SpoIIE family protein phosphatase [Alkalimarinus sediminis]